MQIQSAQTSIAGRFFKLGMAGIVGCGWQSHKDGGFINSHSKEDVQSERNIGLT
jgi:hypothetical protein